ncbi:MAG TPA: phospho-N-acetylmuramoyl-pentapeptide-transferase [Leptospiraceae bacterium]|nr:phospho-N-acetylmuramoyl-pentapeptide-transferase [Spirochaetaceae bacterium]HBS03430.1 phospho-N-acetylmuramoyl-pentapeptide-transferase [Leptospiraceae bacterium]|tara:strand:- start:34248 stop:35357 length:1110 start_codon:yes stop_codon:yes gene_type:complete
MFEYLYTNYDMPGFFRLFGFVSFRALLAGLFSMTLSFVVGDRIIRWLTGLKFRETIRDDGPSSHASKAGTPTMGGILILLSLTVSCVLFGNFSNLHFNLILYCTLLLGAIGFWDDYSKVVLKKKGGMSARTKMALSILIAAFFLFMYINYTPAEVARKDGINYQTADLFIPFIKGPVWTMPLLLGVAFWLCVILGTVHGVNLTDGLDGLAIGNVSIVTVTFGVLAYITGSPRMADYLNIPTVTGAVEISVFLAALAGAGIGFLWFNAAPARIFMGDTGSLSLGGALGMTAIVLKKEILLLVAGGVFVLEALSVILQVGSYKLRKKRIFKMAPLHHHFEELGWPETRIVVRFWLIGLILSLVSLSTLRIQ